MPGSKKDTQKKILRVAKGGASKRYLPLDTQPLQEWLRGRAEPDGDAPGADRVPLIAVETAQHAGNINDFSFPERCEIMVGAEDTGISARVIEALEPSRGDAVVYVPLAGTYHSLNVATALAIAMHEYRRQWPGEDTRRA